MISPCLTTVYDSGTFHVNYADGRAIDAKELRKRLKKETVVLFSADNRPVDPLHLRLYKEDTLVFVLPSGPPPAAQGNTSAAPPSAPVAVTLPPSATFSKVPVSPAAVPPPPKVAPEETVPPSEP
jgi:hypothetical protein